MHLKYMKKVLIHNNFLLISSASNYINNSLSLTTGVIMYKSIMIGNHERTREVIRNAMMKHGLEGSPDSYTLSQILPDKGTYEYADAHDDIVKRKVVAVNVNWITHFHFQILHYSSRVWNILESYRYIYLYLVFPVKWLQGNKYFEIT